MTSQIDAGPDSTASHLQDGKQNATNGGTGQARPGPGGVMTPDPTPEVDEARTNADLTRRQEAASQVTEGNIAGFSTTRDPHPDENHTYVEDSVLRDVMKSGSNEHRKVLGLKERYETDYAEESAILDAFHDRGEAVHPKFNKHKDAEMAFKKILEAGAAFDVGEEEIQMLKDWEGNKEDSMEGLVHTVPVPHKIILGIYEQATRHLAQLQINPKSKVAVKHLDSLNDQIKKQNEKDGLDPSDQWIIQYPELVEIYQEARPAINRVLKDKNDSEARTTLDKHCEALKEIIQSNHYPNWNIDLDVAASEKPRARARSPAPVDSTPKPPESAPADLTSSHPEPTPGSESAEGEGRPTESSGDRGFQMSVQEAPARLQAAQKIQSETLNLWKNMGWSTHKMSDGDTILSHKALSREGKEPYAYEFTVMTQDSPYFQIKLGSEVGRQEKDAYLALPNIYKIVTDPGEKDKPVYTWRQRQDYDRLLWTATKPRKQTQAGKTPRAGDTQCCVLWKNGKVSEMSKAHFTTVVTIADGKKAIEKYCKSVEIKAPWEMDPKTLTVSAASTLGQQLLQAGRTGSAINLNSAAPKVVTSNAENPEAVSSSHQSSLAALQMSMQAIASGFEQSQILMRQQMEQQQLMQSLMHERLKQQEDQQMQLSKTLEGLLKMITTATSQGSTSQVKEESVT